MIELGLLGYPLAHSLSPQIHLAALRYCHLKGNYALFPVHPADSRKLKDGLDRVRTGELTGLNITIPYKQVVIPLLDGLTPRAQAIGAVNTIFMRNNQLIGENTDALGFWTDCQRILPVENDPNRTRKTALVLGAGGAARAVVFALLSENWQVRIAARRVDQARELVSQFPDFTSSLATCGFEAGVFQSLFPQPALIVNTTPIGMQPDCENSPWPAGIPLPCGTVVYDLVYNPRATKFCRDARAAGLSATTGMGMLVEQAALAFEIWTGCRVPREILCEVLEEE